MTRILSPYEKTHLQRFDKGDVDIADFDEMPVEYITGKVEFGNHIFEVNSDVLIPRIESEELINLSLTEIKKRKKEKIMIADVGCGCGAIGISLWLELQKRNIKAELYLSDISTKAIVVTNNNIANLIGESDQVHVLESNLLKNFPPEVKFDLVIANLPYIPTGRVKILDESVRDHEPHLALDGGKEGLELIKRLVKQAQDRLNPNGVILLEVDYTHDKKFLEESLEDYGFTLENSRDQFQRTRFATLSKN